MEQKAVGLEEIVFDVSAGYSPDLQSALVGLAAAGINPDDASRESLLDLTLSAEHAHRLAFSLLHCTAGANFALSAELYARGLDEGGDARGAATVRRFLGWVGGRYADITPVTVGEAE